MMLRYMFILLCITHIGWVQADEVLSANVHDTLQRSVSDHAVLKPTASQHDAWLNEMSHRLQKRMPNTGYRMDFLKTLHYEATRAGLDPQLVLALIDVKSGFNRQSVSSTGAQGYMQVMPFWVKQIGTPDHDLFNIRTNLRYGCTILRHYIDIEKGDLYRALGRYDGSLGKTEFPNKVRAAWQNHWGITTS